MKTFKEFLNESSRLETVVSKINTTCKPFLQQCDHQLLYRGMRFKDKRNPNRPFFSPHPKDRKPLDSSYRFNVLFNLMIEAAFNIKEVRTHAIFCSSDRDTADIYGTRFTIYPKGNFKFLWSPKINDSFMDVSVIIDRFLQKIELKTGNKMHRELLYGMFEYLQTSLSKDFIKGDYNTEIEKYLKDNEEFTNYADFSNVLKDVMTEVGRELYKNDDLAEAIRSGYEIIIYESDGYYSLPAFVAINSQDSTIIDNLPKFINFE